MLELTEANNEVDEFRRQYLILLFGMATAIKLNEVDDPTEILKELGVDELSMLLAKSQVAEMLDGILTKYIANSEHSFKVIGQMLSFAAEALSRKGGEK